MFNLDSLEVVEVNVRTLSEHFFKNKDKSKMIIPLKTEMNYVEVSKLFSDCIFNTDKIFRSFLKNNKFILLGGKVLEGIVSSRSNDYDFYLKNNLSIEELKTIIKEFNEVNKVKFKFVCETEFSLTYYYDYVVVQFIKLDFTRNVSAVDLFKNIDFSASMCAIDFELEKFFCHKSFLRTIKTYEIEFNPNTKFPISSLLRMKKYKQKGFEFNTKEILKMCFAINKLDLNTNRDVIKHLRGISTSYYGDFLDYLSGEDYINNEFDIDTFFDLFEEYSESKLLISEFN